MPHNASNSSSSLPDSVEKSLAMIYEQAKEAFEATKNGKKDVDAATGPSALAAASVEKHVMETKEDIAVSASQTNPLISLPDTPEKPLKNMSQQEKLALKASIEKETTTDAASSKTVATPLDKDVKDTQKKEQFLRPSTPPNQTGSKLRDDDGNSPCSQACTSGTVTPTSEGVKRVDRGILHAPPGGFDL